MKMPMLLQGEKKRDIYFALPFMLVERGVYFLV
jgi:hypothetical protein